MRNKINLSAAAPLVLAALLLKACMIQGSDVVDDTRDPFVPTATVPYVPETPPAQPRRVVLLHTNDEHSHLLGFAPNNLYPFRPHDALGNVDPMTVIGEVMMGRDHQTSGGIVRRQYLVNETRKAARDPVLLLSAGDANMGTVFHAAFTTGAPDFVAMALLGYDFMTVGNHEFDFGPDALAQAIRVAQDTTFGAAVPIVSSNIHVDADGAGQPLTDLGNLIGDGDSGAAIVPFATKVLPNGLKVGFLGATGYDAALVSPALGAVSFSVPDGGEVCDSSDDCAGTHRCVRGHCADPLDAMGHLVAMVGDMQPWVSLLRDVEQVDLVVVLSHMGNQEDQFLAANVTGIDVIIGGHSHDRLAPYTIGDTIITQAGSYGRWLGKLVISVAPDGTVTFDSAASDILDVDYTLDSEIIAVDTNGDRPDLVRALELTGAIITPVVAGLNAQLGPLLGANILDDPLTSTYDVIGEKDGQDHQLFHLVTDSVWNSVVAGGCLPAYPFFGTKYVVVVQANGVIRESLRFTDAVYDTGTTSVADIFSVLPLGGSPLESVQIPGFPLVMFDLAPGDLFAGLDIGVTKGLESYSFFLSYSGMRVNYDTGLDAFDPVTFNPFSTEPGGRIVRIQMGNDLAGWQTVYEYNPVAGLPWIARWSNLDIAGGETITVITNLYLAGYLEAFGITPRDPTDGKPFDPIGSYSSMGVLAQTFLCNVGHPTTLSCPATPVIAPCWSAATNVGGLDCTMVGPYTGGTLACGAPYCALDTSGCIAPVCGDGVVELTEQCEAEVEITDDCTTIGMGFTDGSDLGCNVATCTFDTNLCTGGPVCDNNILEAGEQCDDTQLGGADCTSIGMDFGGGDLACASDCTFDTSACTGGPVCGDGVIEFGEQCDDIQLGGATCQLLGYGFSGGTLACSDQCKYDVTGCTRDLCGNMMVDPGEMCEGGVPWPTAFIEAKEWGVLLKYLIDPNALNGDLGNSMVPYNEASFVTRVCDIASGSCPP